MARGDGDKRSLTEKVAAAIVRGRFFVVAGWFLAAIAALQLLPSIEEGGRQSIRGLVPADSRAIQAEVDAFERFGTPLLSRTQIVQRDPDGLSAYERGRIYLRAISINRGLYEDPALKRIGAALPVVNSFNIFPQGEDGTTAVTYLFFLPEHSPTDRTRSALAFGEEIAQDGDGYAGVTGAVPGRIAQGNLIKEHLSNVELLTVALVALIVGIHFRSVAAPLVTLAAAWVAYTLTIHTIPWVVGQLGFSVPNELEPVIVVLLLGIVTDYSIFFMDGAQNRLAQDEDRLTAARLSTSSLLAIIVVAGLTVAAGTAALIVASLDIFSALGPGLALTVMIGLLVSITMVPAVIGILGRFLFWPAKPRSHSERRTGPIRQAFQRRYRDRRMASIVGIATLLLLVLSALLVTSMSLGFSVVGDLPPDSEPRVAASAAARGFAPGVVSPLMLVLESEGIGEKEDELSQLEELIEDRPGIAGVVGPEEVVALSRVLRRAPNVPRLGAGGREAAEIALRAVISEDGNAARFLIMFDRPPLSGEGVQIYDDLRKGLFPLLQQTRLGRVSIGFAGDTAIAHEMISKTIEDLKRVALAVFVVDLIILALFLRAIVAPLYLMLASLLGFAASLGFTTLFFQVVLGGGSFSFFVPFAASVLLVSLGSDYNIFLVGSIWRTGKDAPLVDAMTVQAPAASRAIAVAGVTLAASFAILGVVPLGLFRQFAFAMAAGLLIDTFLVRPLLVPSIVTIFGETSRWPSGAIQKAKRRRER